MAKETVIQSTIVQNPDGTTKEIIVNEVEVEVPTAEEILAEKEAALIEMYEEIAAKK